MVVVVSARGHRGRVWGRLSDKVEIGQSRGCRVQGQEAGVRVWNGDQRLGPATLLPMMNICFSLVKWEDPGVQEASIQV